MDEARSLQYSINVKADVAKAERDIQNLISQCGRLRAEASGTIDIAADTEQALVNIRELTQNIGAVQSDTGIVINADTDQAETNVRELTEGIGSIETGTVEVDVDTERAQTNVKNLTDTVTNLGRGPPDIEIDADTSDAERSIRGLTKSIGGLKDNAGGIGAAFRKSFLAGIDGGDSFASSLKSGVGGALAYTGGKLSEFKDNVVGAAKSIGHGFAHPIETINFEQGCKSFYLRF